MQRQIRQIVRFPLTPPNIGRPPVYINPNTPIPDEELPAPVKPSLPHLPSLPSLHINADKVEYKLIEFVNNLMDSIFGEFRKYYIPLVGVISLATLGIAGIVALIIFRLF